MRLNECFPNYKTSGIPITLLAVPDTILKQAKQSIANAKNPCLYRLFILSEFSESAVFPQAGRGGGGERAAQID